MLTALRTETKRLDREDLLFKSRTHGLSLVGQPSEDVWRSHVWRIVRHYQEMSGAHLVPLSHLRLWLRWDVAAQDGWPPPASLAYCEQADEMILDALNSDDSGLALYPLTRPLKCDE